MKKIISLLIVMLTVSLFPISFELSHSIRSPKNNSKPLDYEFSTTCRLDSLLLVSLEYERDNGKYYRNVELFAWQYWKFLQFSGKYINIEEDDLQNISLDVRVKHKTHSIGVAEVWNLRPSTNLVFGEDVRWAFGIPFVCPIKFRGITNFYTNDLKKFNNETEITFSGKLSSLLSLYYRFKQRYYDEWNWSSKIGVEIEF